MGCELRLKRRIGVCPDVFMRDEGYFESKWAERKGLNTTDNLA